MEDGCVSVWSYWLMFFLQPESQLATGKSRKSQSLRSGASFWMALIYLAVQKFWGLRSSSLSSLEDGLFLFFIMKRRCMNTFVTKKYLLFRMLWFDELFWHNTVVSFFKKYPGFSTVLMDAWVESRFWKMMTGFTYLVLTGTVLMDAWMGNEFWRRWMA